MELVHTAFLLLGSNVGNKLNWLKQAITSIEKEVGFIEKISSVYETEAWGNTNQDSYYNILVVVKTDLPPLSLLEATQKIEQACERNRIVHWGPRTMDIDILFYDDLVFQNEHLSIPHQLIQERRFVLVPLFEIAPSWVHPKLKIDIATLISITKDNSNVMNLGDINLLQ